MNQEFNDIPEEALKDDETLVKFLRGELSAEDEAAFIQKLRENPELKTRATAVARLIKGIENKGVADDENLKSAFKKLSIDDVKNISKPSSENEKPAAKTIKFKKIFAWAMSAAAVLVLVFGLRIFYVNSSYEKIAAEYENSVPLSEILRGRDEDIKKEVNTLCNNVLQGINLDSTIERLNEIFEKSQDEIFNEYSNYFETSGWFLSLAHLKNHDPEKAKPVLKKLVENPDVKRKVKDNAKEILKRLE